MFESSKNCTATINGTILYMASLCSQSNRMIINEKSLENGQITANEKFQTFKTFEVSILYQ